MPLQKKRFTKVNEAFVCNHCKHKNPPSETSCRNHCQKCLTSKHLDINPGDRAANCSGLMVATDFFFKGGQVTKIIFVCQKCGAIKHNKPAPDDNREKIYEILRSQ